MMRRFEATGDYHRALAWRLGEAGFTVRLISSVALARTREALHNGWDKNDPKDAQVILHMLRIGSSQRFYDPLGQGINDLQELPKTHDAIARMKTLTMLYRSTDRICRCGAPMEYLAHNASLHSNVKNAPSKPGIKQLIDSLSCCAALPRTISWRLPAPGFAQPFRPRRSFDRSRCKHGPSPRRAGGR